MNNGLTTNLLLFLPIKIIFLSLFYLNGMDFVYGYDLIFVQEPNNIDEYEVRFIQFSGNPQNPQSQSGSLEEQPQQQQPQQQQQQQPQQQQQQQLPSGNEQTPQPHQPEQQQLPSGDLQGVPQ